MGVDISRFQTMGSTLAPTSLYSTIFRRRSDYLFLFAICLIGCYIYYTGLDGYELQTWDEGHYGVIAYQMFAHNHWLTPYHYQFSGSVSLTPYFEKPPLVFWLQAISMYVFGPTPVAVRFPSATFAILTGGVVYIFGRTLSTRRTGLFASVVFLTTPYLFAGNDAGRTGGVDTALVFFGTLFVFFAWSGATRRETSWIGPMWVAAALALLTKGPAFGIYLIVLLPLALANWRRFLCLRVLKYGVVPSLLVLVWPLYMALQYGADFVQTIFVEQVVGRALGTAFISYPDALFSFMRYPYFTHLPTFYDPWVYLLIPATRFSISASHRRGSRDRQRDTWFLLWWLVVVLVFFSFTGNHPWYILPIYVPGALLLGRLFEATTRGDIEALTSTVVGVLAILVFSYRMPFQSPIAIERAYGLQGYLPSGEHFLAAIILGTGGLITAPALDHRLRFSRAWDGPLKVMAVIAIVVFAGTIASPVTFPGHSWDRQQHELADLVQQETPSDASIYFQPAATNQAAYHAFAFHAKRSLRSVSINQMNTNEKIRYAIVTAGSHSQLTRPYDVLAVGRTRRGTDILFLSFSQ